MHQSAITRLIFEAVSDMIIIIQIGDDDSFRCVTANPAYLKRMGLELSKVSGCRIEDFLPPEAAPFMLSKYRDAVRLGQTHTYEEQIELPSGTVYVETNLQPIEDEETGKIRHLLSVARDMTERRRAEQQMADNALRYRSLFVNHPDAVFVIDADSKFTHLNEQAVALIGYRHEELIGQSFPMLVAPDSIDSAKQSFHTVFTGVPVEFETMLLHRDGTKLQMLITVTPVMLENGIAAAIGTAKDVTAQHASEQRLIDSDERYKKLLELLPSAVLVHTDGLIVFCNKECAASFGAKDPAALIGVSIDQLVDPDSFEAVLHRTKSLLEQQSEFVTKELTYVRLDLTSFEVESTAAFIVYEGKPSVQVVFRDITERKKAELQLREANDRLRKLSHADGLTGVANRRRFDEALGECAVESAALGLPMAIIMMDIDAFKSFNDHYGHPRGDDCLRLISLELQQQLGTETLAARYGGEEFVVLLPNVGLWEAAAAAERIRSGIERLGIVHDYSPAAPVVTVSVGVASFVPGSPEEAWQLLHLSDQALYDAKNTGRNRVSLKLTD